MTNPIPLLDLKRQYRQIREETLSATEEIYESQWFILGPRVEAFEKNLAEYCHASHAVGVSSGTDALLEALMVIGVGPGDEVIIPAYSFFATAGVVARLGALPVFVDIEPDTFNIDPALIEEKISEKTKAIMPVHLFGQLADMPRINEIGAANGLPVIEDSAQAIGAELDGKRAGSWSSYGCFSFFPSKNLGAFGDGGAITTDSEEIWQRLIDYRVHGMRPKYYHHSVGGNFRLDALQAAILDIKLKYLDEWTKGRQRNASRYENLLAPVAQSGELTLPKVVGDRRHVYNQYIIRFRDQATRDRVRQAMTERAIGTDIYYPLTLPQQECFSALEQSSVRFPVSEAAAATSLAIPIFSELTDEELERTAETITEAL